MQEIDGLLKWRFTESSAHYCLLKRHVCSGIYTQKVIVRRRKLHDVHITKYYKTKYEIQLQLDC